MLFQRSRRLLGALVGAALLLLYAAPVGAQTLDPASGRTLFVYRQIEARTQPRDFSEFEKVTPELNGALRAYQTEPSMKTAIGVLQFFKSHFYEMTADQRKALFAADADLFLSLDVAKYELVMHARIDSGATSSRRVGSSGQRELEIIRWRKGTGPKPDLDPARQFTSDDDVTNLSGSADRLADEGVNGDSAKAAFKSASRAFGLELEPTTVRIEFLSPTKAWQVFKERYPGSIPPPPEFLYAFTAANAEKYNDPFGVYMLDVWGSQKGVITNDVKNPMDSTEPYRPDPGRAPASSLFAYIADNYRQIYSVHEGRFESECKYLVRIIDGWATLMGEGRIKEQWLRIREQAEAVYKKGVNVDGADEFRAVVGRHIRNTVLDGHQYQLTRVAAELKKALPALKNVPVDSLGLASFERFPELVREMNGLLIAYTNVPPELHQDLMTQFAQVITASDPVVAHLLTRAMEVVQAETDFQRGNIEAFRTLREKVNANLSDGLTNIDLARFLEQVALGNVKQTVLRLEGLRVVRHETLGPQDVLRHVELIQALAKELGWSNEQAAKRLADYLRAGPDADIGIRILQRLYRIFDSTGAPAVPLPRIENAGAGASLPAALEPSRTNLGVRLFAAALQAPKAAAKGVETGIQWWGHAQTGQELFVNLKQLLIERGAMSDLELGRTQAALLANIIDFETLVAPEKWKVRGSGVLTSNTVNTLSASAGAVWAGDREAANELFYSAFKDLAILYEPHLAAAIALFELTRWGYQEWSMSGARTDVVDAMVENGVWEPADADGMKRLPAGGLPKLVGIRRTAQDGSVDKRLLAKHALDALTLLKSGRTIRPRQALLDLAYDSGQMKADPIIAASIAAVEELSGGWLQQLFSAGTLSSQPNKTAIYEGWTKEALKKAGIEITRDEDDRRRPARPSEVKSGSNELRVMGYLVADFWVKQQILLEEALLPALEKEAARRVLSAVETERAVATSTYMDEVNEILRDVAAIDQFVWPRIAASAAPAERSTNPAASPILDAFKGMPQVANAISLLQQIQKLIDDRRNPDPLRSVGATGSEPDPRAVVANAETQLQVIREAYFGVLDKYEAVVATIDRAQSVVEEGKITVDPAHVQLAPGPMTLGAWDLTKTTKWLDGYLLARRLVLTNIVERTKTAPPESFIEALYQDAVKLLDKPDTSGSPTHPFWPRLVRLRFEIRKLETMKDVAATMTPQELRDSVRGMTIQEGEVVTVTSSDVDDKAGFLTKTIQQMEDEYQRLLGNLTMLFDVAVTAGNASPFIGQQVRMTASYKANPSSTIPFKTGSNGFPDVVARFQWTIRDAQGLTLMGPFDSDGPVWPVTLARAGTYVIEGAALDRGGNVIARSFATPAATLTARPLTLTGRVGVQSGDYQGQKIDLITSVTGVRGTMTLSQLGQFELEVIEYDEKRWKTALMGARTSAAGRTTDSRPIGFSANPAGGRVTLKDDLLIPFPFNVTVTLSVVDRAGLDVPAATAAIVMFGNDVAVGRTAAVYIWPRTPVAARVAFAPLQISQDVAAVPFETADKRVVALKASLPMFDVNRVTVSGRFVSDASLIPAPDLSGQVTSNAGNVSVGIGGLFSFTNSKPIDLRAAATLQAHAVLIDTEQRLYQPKVPITAPLATTRIELGAIEVVRRGITVRPIQARLFDLTGAPLPEGTGEFLIGSLAAARTGDVFTGEHTFAKADESIIVQGGYTLPNGQKSVVQKELRASMFIGPQAPALPPYAMKLPFYLPGRLHLTGKTRVDRISTDTEPPAQIDLQDAAHGLRRREVAGTAFDITLPVPVQATEGIALVAWGQGSGQVIYQGAAMVRAPASGSSLAIGEIVLAAAGAGVPGFLAQNGQGTTDGAGGTSAADAIAKARDKVNKAAQDEAARAAKPITPAAAGGQNRLLQDVIVNSRTMTITVWDNECEDGDRITVRINGQAVVNNHLLRKQKESFQVTLTADESVIELIAESSGTDCPPGQVAAHLTRNSGAISISGATSGGSQTWNVPARASSSARIVVRR